MKEPMSIVGQIEKKTQLRVGNDRRCGARFAGAGAGGSVWALGEKKRIKELKSIWRSTLAPIKGAGILDCAVDPRGVR